MKKIISLLLIAVLIIALAIPAMAEAVGEKQGVIKAFDAASVTLNVAGKSYTYTIDSQTVVKRIDQEVDFLDVAKKGIKVTFKNSDSKLTYINIPNIGAEMQGVAKIAVSDVRVNPTDSSLSANDTTASVDAATGEVTQTTVTRVKKLGLVDCDEYAYDNDKKVTLGDITVDKASVKVILNGNALKVITDGKTEFDPAVVGDEVKLVEKITETKTINGIATTITTYPSYTLEFEAPITDAKSPSIDLISLILKVYYQKQTYEITTTETNFLPVDNDAVIELNGKEVSLLQATNVGNYWFVRANPEGNAIHVDSFYRDVEAVFTGLSNNLIKVNIMKNGKIVGADTLTPSDGLTILSATGKEITVKDLKVNDKLTITTEPADGYRATFIQVK